MMKKFLTLSIVVMSIATSVTISLGKSAEKSEKTYADTSQSTARKEYYELAQNVKLHVTDLGDGPVVVLIPGYPLGDESWEYQYPALVKAGYRVIGITMRGFGKSDKPYGKYTYDQFADDIKSVLDQMDIKDAILGGHSMGGAIALHYTAKYNGAHLKKLALFAAAAPRHTKTADYPYPLFEKATISGWVNQISIDRPALLAGIGSQFALTPTAINPGIGNWLYNQELQSSPYAMEKALISLRDEDLRADLPKIKIPTLIMQAKEDHIVAYALAQQMNKAIAGSRLVTFDKSGHALFIEEREKFNNEFLKFIKE